MSRKITLNEHDMGCSHHPNNRVGCGTCGRSWCDICHPTPSARCLFEYEHTPLAPHGGCNWKGCRECFPHEEDAISNERFDQLIQEATRLESEQDYGKPRTQEDDAEFVAAIEPRKLPHLGMLVCDCQYKHLKIKAIDKDGDTVTLEDGSTCSFNHCCDPVPHDYGHPCPVCGDHSGFHDDEKHRKDVDPKYLKEKGWHNAD